MQENLMQAQTQPFIKLAQANMALLAGFSTSPEVTAQAGTNAGQMFQQASQSAMKLMQSGAMAQLMQGLMKNYAEFYTELSQSGMAMLTQGHAAMTRQVQDASEQAMQAGEARTKRTR